MSSSVTRIGMMRIRFLLLYVLVLNFCCAVRTLCMISYFSLVSVIEWPPIGKMAAHSVYNMFS